jgi:hypothetical protein
MIPFHRLLISTGIAFCIGFAAWCLWHYRDSHSLGMLVVALVFAAAAGGLIYYLRHLNRFLGR